MSNSNLDLAKQVTSLAQQLDSQLEAGPVKDTSSALSKASQDLYNGLVAESTDKSPPTEVEAPKPPEGSNGNGGSPPPSDAPAQIGVGGAAPVAGSIDTHLEHTPDPEPAQPAA